jgi:hypothetical protein
MFEELDVVKTLVKKDGFKIDTEGVIVVLIPEKNGVVLEMYDEDGHSSEELVCYTFQEIELVWKISKGNYV